MWPQKSPCFYAKISGHWHMRWKTISSSFSRHTDPAEVLSRSKESFGVSTQRTVAHKNLYHACDGTAFSFVLLHSICFALVGTLTNSESCHLHFNFAKSRKQKTKRIFFLQQTTDGQNAEMKTRINTKELLWKENHKKTTRRTNSSSSSSPQHHWQMNAKIKNKKNNEIQMIFLTKNKKPQLKLGIKKNNQSTFSVL